MNTTTPQLTDVPPRSGTSRPVASRRLGSASRARPTWIEALSETAPVIGAPAFFGPPIIFVLGPWLLLVLLLIGPFALVLTLLLVLAAAAALLAALVAVIASPYLLIRHLHAQGMAHEKPRARVQVFRNHRVGAGRLGSPQPKGVS
jgi:hypothetical protein